MIKQEAILLTKDNALTVAATLTGTTADDVRLEADHLFTLNGSVVLVALVYSDGMRLLNYVVHDSLYKVNNDNFAALNDHTYVPVNPI